jgi:hypothetical protein
MPIEFSGNTSFGGGGGMNVSSQLSGLREIDMGDLDMGDYKYLLKPQNSGGGWAGGENKPKPAAAPPREMIQYTTGVTPQGVQYRTPINGPNAGQVEYTGGMPERFGGYVGAQPGYPGGGR